MSLTAHSFSRERGLWLWIGTAFVLDLAGAQHVYTLSTVIAAALLMLTLLWLIPPWLWRTLLPSQHAPQRLLTLFPMLSFIAAMVDVASFVPLNSGWNVGRLMALVTGIGLLLAAGRGAAGWSPVVAIVLGIGVRITHMRHIAIVPTNGDMLPLVQGALNNLFAGRSPYTTYKMPWEVPLTYLPITWLSYLPPYLLGLDLRWSNIAAEIGVLGALAWLGARRNGWRATWRSEPTLVLWAWLFLQPSVIHWDMGNTAPITWLLLAWTFALALGGSDRGAAIALGLAAAGTPLVAVFGVFIGLYWLRRYGLLHTIRLGAVCGIVAAIVVVPFLLWAPQDFITGTYRWFNNINGWPRQKWIETDPHIWSVISGFSGEFWARGAERWLKPIQAAIVLIVAGGYWLRGGRAEELASYAAAAYLGFMLFNPVLWPYLYNPALVVGLIGIAGRGIGHDVVELVVARRMEPAVDRASFT